MHNHSESDQGLGSDLLSDAKGVGQTAVNRLHSEVEARKGGAASQVVAVSSAIERAADGLDENAPTWLKPALEKGAEQIHSFANSLEHKDSRQLTGDLSEFARNSPGTFLSLCAAVGFAAARVFKAGADGSTQQPSAMPPSTDATTEFSGKVTSGSNDLPAGGAIGGYA